MVLGNIPWLSLLQPQQLQEGKCHGCENTDLMTGLSEGRDWVDVKL